MNMKIWGRLIKVLLLACLFLFPTNSLHAQNVELMEDFEDPSLPGWERSDNALVSDGTLKVSNRGFAFHGGLWHDLNLTIRMNHPGTGAGGIHYRESDTGSYVVRFEPDFIALTRHRGADIEEIIAGPNPGPFEEWVTVNIIATGDSHIISLNGSQVLAANDAATLPPGGIGMRYEGEGAVAFDDLTLTTSGTSPDEVKEPPPVGESPQQPGGASQPAYLSTPWLFTGGPSGGLGYDIRMRPDNPDIMFVTDAFAGVFKSTDGGKTWSQSNTGITTRLGGSGDAIPIFSLTIDPNNPDTVWAGTQYSSGVFKSIDGGATWMSMNTGNNGIQEEFISVRGFSIQPGNSDVVYMAGEVSSWEWNGETLPGKGLDMTKGVIYKTINGGSSWTRIWYGDNLARYVLIHPVNTDVLIASTGIFDREAANSNPNTDDPGGVGILRSYDGGQTWEILNENYGINKESLYFGSLFMHPDNPNILFGAAGNDPYNRPGGIYRTTDGGDSWTKVLDLLHASAVEVCESNPGVVYAGSINGFFRSDDGGDNWTKLADTRWGPPGVVAGFPIDLQCDPRNSDRIFVNNYGGGNFLSTDAGENWVDSSQGYTGAWMSEVAVAQDNSGLVYGSARSGIFSSWDGGTTWTGLSSGVARDLEGYFVAVDPFDSLHVYIGLADTAHVPKESKDGGQTWSDVNVDFLFKNNTPINTLIKAYFNPGVEDAIFFAPGDQKCGDQPIACDLSRGTGLYFSQDGGDSWSQTSLTSGTIIQVAFSQDGSTVYAGDRSGNIYRSTDYGQTWQTINTNFFPPETITPEGFKTGIFRGFLVDPNDSNTIYLGAEPGGFFISHDGGQTWQTSNSGMPPEIRVVDMVMDPTNSQVIYLGTRGSGVFLSQDGGNSWQALNQGLSMRELSSLTISKDGSVVYAATVGAGVFRLGTPSISTQPPTSPSTEPGTGQPSGEEPSPEEPTSGFPCLSGFAPILLFGFAWMMKRKK